MGILVRLPASRCLLYRSVDFVTNPSSRAAPFRQPATEKHFLRITKRKKGQIPLLLPLLPVLSTSHEEGGRRTYCCRYHVWGPLFRLEAAQRKRDR